MRQNLKISIITPSFNQGQFLEETILSVLNQSYDNIEHIVIDGGSTDNSVEIIKKYEKHLSYWVSEKDKGQSDAINKGLKICTGDIITWLNSDDIFLPNILNEIPNYFAANPNLGLVHGKAILFGSNRKDLEIGEEKSNMKERYLAYIPFPQPASFFSRNVIEETGFLNVDFHYGMDFDLLTRIALNFDITHIDKVLTKYRIHESSKTNDDLKFALDWQKVFSKTLYSIDSKNKYIEVLKQLNFYHLPTGKYEIKIMPTNIKLITLYFLHIQMHYYYQAFEFKKVLEIAKQIKILDGHFYKLEAIDKLVLKAKYLPKGIIKQLRNFTR